MWLSNENKYENLYSHDGSSVSEELLKLQSPRYSSCAVIVDMEKKDQPIIFVTNEFCRVTGYYRSQVMGRNCRFLQGYRTQKEDVDDIRNAIEEKLYISIDIINYTKYGEEFFNLLKLNPIFRDDGKLVKYCAHQTFSFNIPKSIMNMKGFSEKNITSIM